MYPQNGSGNSSGQRMCLFDALETGSTGFSADAEEQGLSPLTIPPWPPSLSPCPFFFHAGRLKGDEAWLARKHIGTPSCNTGTGRAQRES